MGGLRRRFDQLGGLRPRHIAVIVVNAEVHPKPSFSLVPTSPSLATIVNAVADVGIYNYNFETLELMRESLINWVNELPPDAHGRRVQTYLIDVAFSALEDPGERDFFNAIGTSFNLDDETVDRLIAVGRRLLRESPDFQQLVASLRTVPAR